MRFPHEASTIPGSRELPPHSRFSDIKTEIDSIVPNSVGTGKQSRQYRRASGLTHHIGSYTVRETRPIASERIEMRCSEIAALKSKAVPALLI
jgi:hypothetical protein